MRPVISFVVASVLYVSTANATEVTPLPSGKASGVHQAQLEGDISPLIYFGVVAVGIGIALAASNNVSTSAPAPATSASSGTTG